jgi:hypothetical protein
MPYFGYTTRDSKKCSFILTTYVLGYIRLTSSPMCMLFLHAKSCVKIKTRKTRHGSELSSLTVYLISSFDREEF